MLHPARALRDEPNEAVDAVYLPAVNIDCGSLCFSRNFSGDYEERLLSLKENGTRHGRCTALLRSR